MTKETVVALIPNAETSYNKGFIEYIVKQLSQGLSDKLITILDKETEVIVKQSKVRVREYKPTDSVEYRRQIEWSPLVRCKDCKHHQDEEVGMVYCPQIVGGWVSNKFFCADGERREDEQDDD